MSRAPRKQGGDKQLQLLPTEQNVLADVLRKSTSITEGFQQLIRDLNGGVGLVKLSIALKALRDAVQDLNALVEPLDQLEADWTERLQREVLEMEAVVRQQLGSRGWHVEGQWPKLYVERAIAVEFDEGDRSFKLRDRVLPGASANELVTALIPLVAELVPRNFSETRFMQSLADAYDELRDGKSSQIPILRVYQQLVIRQQKPNFWKDARDGLFVGMSIDQFRARLSKALANNATIVTGNRELRLLPPIDTKNALYLYQPAERRFGFVGRIEFVRTQT